MDKVLSLLIAILPIWPLVVVTLVVGGGLTHSAFANPAIHRSTVALVIYCAAMAQLASGLVALILTHHDPISPAACLLGGFGRIAIPLVFVAMAAAVFATHRLKKETSQAILVTAQALVLFAAFSSALAWIVHARSALRCTV